MNLICELISSFDPAHPNFRPTEIYNEGWLLKLVLHQASTFQDATHALGFLPRSDWYSEALLPTAFKARYRGDPFAEKRTHADGVIGHVVVGRRGKADLELASDAAQLTVVEAKIGAPLARGTKNASYFDQAARNVACIAEVLAKAEINPTALNRLDFVVLAPQQVIKHGTFSAAMDLESIQSKVQRRVAAYEGQLDRWYTDRFEPMLAHLRLHTLSWESTIIWIGDHKPHAADELTAYLQSCLDFN